MSDVHSLPHVPSAGDLERFDAAVDDARRAWDGGRCPSPEDVAIIFETSGLDVDCELVPADVLVCARRVVEALLAMPVESPAYDDCYASVVLWNTRKRPDDPHREPFKLDLPKGFEDIVERD